ncbi:hypothetical protein DL766_006421 [Monosporascus sp. MC13-8B]|uniref:Major facilitator superfamily (MFS) profile domain-containing protein n=1 Tax=Monosporascus cannonballus TaxID=155416 RepID=A0ABY0HD53_9PEZI|nr:hypothetical protein DL762_002960 [Monosporascus cannonballus]RYP27359.1 hypothetical protein DL766_006421 [Monosporascus sp. MC13-8B]
MFRAMQDIAVALSLPTIIGSLTIAIAPGRRRNTGFSLAWCWGIFINAVGWRVGWYVVAATSGILSAVGVDTLARLPTLHSLPTHVD